MIYNNLIYFLVVILILTTNTAADHPQLPALANLTLFLAKGLLYHGLLHRIFSRARVTKAGSYSKAERQGSILAIIFFSLDVYLLDCQYYFGLLPGAHTLPIVGHLVSLALFTAYLGLLWVMAAGRYREIFNSSQTSASFAWNNLKANLPIILPWLALSLLADLLERADIPLIKEIMASAWGEETIFLVFFLCLAIIFPVLVTRMWSCTPMPPCPARGRIEALCQRQGVGYADILLWPLHEGQALTAGVMGIITRFRYLLVTPALLEAMSADEIEAVMAHELGHVKKRHLQLFLLLFMGFGLLAQLSSYPMLYLLTNSDLFYRMVHLANNKPSNTLAFASTVPLFVLMIVYFRYVLGFFMRNFERQADLYALQTMKTSAPLIRVFEKIAWLSGEIRDLPSWHHFGIGERIDYLEACSREPSRIKAHDRKVYGALILYGVILAICSFILWKIPDNLQEGPPREKFVEAVIRQKIEEEPRNYIWPQLLGDLQYSRQRYHEAVSAYQKALELSPKQPEILNNLAWLLMTAGDITVLDPKAALPLAERAAALEPSGHILDTLALAYWQNGLREQALQAELRAMKEDPANRDYYTAQLKKFTDSEPLPR